MSVGSLVAATGVWPTEWRWNGANQPSVGFALSAAANAARIAEAVHLEAGRAANDPSTASGYLSNPQLVSSRRAVSAFASSTAHRFARSPYYAFLFDGTSDGDCESDTDEELRESYEKRAASAKQRSLAIHVHVAAHAGVAPSPGEALASVVVAHVSVYVPGKAVPTFGSAGANPAAGAAPALSVPLVQAGRVVAAFSVAADGTFRPAPSAEVLVANAVDQRVSSAGELRAALSQHAAAERAHSDNVRASFLGSRAAVVGVTQPSPFFPAAVLVAPALDGASECAVWAFPEVPQLRTAVDVAPPPSALEEVAREFARARFAVASSMAAAGAGKSAAVEPPTLLRARNGFIEAALQHCAALPQ